MAKFLYLHQDILKTAVTGSRKDGQRSTDNFVFGLFTPPPATGQIQSLWSPALLILVSFKKYCYLSKKLEFYKSPNAYMVGWYSGVDTTTQLFKHRLWLTKKKITLIQEKKSKLIFYIQPQQQKLIRLLVH